MARYKRISKSRLKKFGPGDYFLLASTLALALNEELDSDDFNLLTAFVTILADELALIDTLNSFPTSDDDSDSSDDVNEDVIPTVEDSTSSSVPIISTIKDIVPAVKGIKSSRSTHRKKVHRKKKKKRNTF